MDDKLQFILKNSEKAVHLRSGRKINGRPLLLWPDGRIRVEWLGTYKNVNECYKHLKTIFENTVVEKASNLPKCTYCGDTGKLDKDYQIFDCPWCSSKEKVL